MPLLGYIKNNKKVKNAYYLDIIGTPITYQDFMQLTPAQQENGNWYVTGMSPMVNAYSIMYKNGLSIGQALDEINADKVSYPDYATRVQKVSSLSVGTSMTSVYTVEDDGYITFHVEFSGTSTARLAIYINGGYVTACYISQIFFTPIPVKKGDVITAQHNGTSGSIDVYYNPIR